MQKAYEDKIVILDPKHIHPHPNNPRKDLGDLTELRASVKKNGIMQNLTVIPLDEPGEYMALIGHRRSEAARLEELEGVPCIIKEGLSELEQLNIMMEENMQRNDLSIYEQAQGFQMMLDLGETAESIASKSGFSVSTVYHRLNIAKLNQKELHKKENDGNFQLSLQDLYELEKIQNIKTRNKILKDATDSRNLAARARDAARNEKREKAVKEILKLLKKLNIQITEKTDYVWYSNKYDRVKEINLDGKIPENLNIKGDGPFYYKLSGASFYIVKKAEKKEKKKTPTDILWDKREKNKKQMKSIVKNMDKRRRQFILDIICGAIEPVKNETELKDTLWKQLLECGTGLYSSILFRFYTEKDSYNCTPEEKKEGNKFVDELSILHQMLIFLSNNLNGLEPFDYFSQFNKSAVEKYEKKFEVFVKYGWYFTEEEQQLLDGTHELYEKEEKK